MSKNTKEIGYSYPTSANAARFGFTKTGCYTVSVRGKKTKAFAAFNEARAYADTLPQVYGRYSLTYDNKGDYIAEGGRAESAMHGKI